VTDLHNNPAISTGKATRFRELVAWWTEQLGRHHIPLREHFDDINDMLSPDAVHHELIREIVRTVYCVNHCGNPGAEVTMEDTFTALGQVRRKLLKSAQSDVDQINLLDNIGWYTREYFGPGTDQNDTARAAAAGREAGRARRAAAVAGPLDMVFQRGRTTEQCRQPARVVTARPVWWSSPRGAG